MQEAPGCGVALGDQESFLFFQTFSCNLFNPPIINKPGIILPDPAADLFRREIFFPDPFQDCRFGPITIFTDFLHP